jgi:hypothetical protein
VLLFKVEIPNQLRMNYLRRAYMVTASDLQTALLLQLNTSQNVTWEEFSANVALAASELEKTLASLVASKLLLRSAGERWKSFVF